MVDHDRDKRDDEDAVGGVTVSFIPVLPDDDEPPPGDAGELAWENAWRESAWLATHPGRALPESDAGDAVDDATDDEHAPRD